MNITYHRRTFSKYRLRHDVLFIIDIAFFFVIAAIIVDVPSVGGIDINDFSALIGVGIGVIRSHATIRNTLIIFPNQRTKIAF